MVGTKKGLLYLRCEYRYLLAPLKSALAGRREKTLLGKIILGQTGFDFEIEGPLGAGAQGRRRSQANACGYVPCNTSATSARYASAINRHKTGPIRFIASAQNLIQRKLGSVGRTKISTIDP